MNFKNLACILGLLFPVLFQPSSLFASSQPYISDHHINFGIGNLYHGETDLRLDSPAFPLRFQRTYNSQIGSYRLSEPDGSSSFFDSTGRLISRQDKNGNILHFSYNGSTLISVHDDFGRAITLHYSVDNGLLKYLDTPVGTFTYDPADNLVSQTNGNNITTTYTYDALNRLTAVHYPDSAQDILHTYDETGTDKLIWADSRTSTDYTYEGAGNMTTRGTTAFVWNRNNQLIRALENANPVGEYSYDARGLRTSTTVNGTTTYFIHDNTGNLVAETDDQGNVRVVTDEASVQLTITLDGAVQGGVKVYLFSESGTYLGQYAITDNSGRVSFTMPTGVHYTFRADLLGNQYWSDVVTVQSGGTSVAIDTCGCMLRFTLTEAAGLPLAGIKTYLFSPSGSYLGISATSDSQGQVVYSVPAGTYKIRADYIGYRFWIPEYTVTASW
jgi:YD repeat-containing protein